MERLTKVDDQGRLLAYSTSDTGLPAIIMKGNPYRELIERLKAYEDTGLEPCEIPVLLDRLKRASEQWNIWCDAYQKDVPVWVPVTERLPEIVEPVLITVWDKDVTIGTWYGNRWGTALRYNEDVLAWMPRPEPYRPQELEEAGQDAAAPVLQSAT